MGKSPEMEKFLEGFAQKTFGRSRKGNACVTCGSTKVNREDFNDSLSLKEFGISHMCQKCQDSVFGGEPEPEIDEGNGWNDYYAKGGTDNDDFDYSMNF